MKYVGDELELFSRARNWKSYFCTQIKPFLGPEVVEVGAGLGGTTRVLLAGGAQHRSWLCLEPDAELCAQIEGLPAFCEARPSTLEPLPDECCDSILYIDVLEHIEHDHAELELALRRLRPGGHLIVLSPAHQNLFSPFDQAIGHFRRYSRQSLIDCAPAGSRLVLARYLDSLGFFLSWANSKLLRQSMPTPGQIAFWDTVVVPVSRRLDPLLGYHFGKTVLCVWQKGQVESCSHLRNDQFVVNC